MSSSAARYVLAMLLLSLACAGPDTDDTEQTRPPKDDSATDSATTGIDTDTEPVDADGDGFTGGEDCDDNDDSVYPGAPEHCDGRDEDCDGTADDNAVDGTTWYTDGDRDGYGDPASPVTACDLPPGVADAGDDCDDTDANAHPGGTELACTAVDEDCDGAFDEGDDSGMGILLNGRIYPRLQEALNAGDPGDTLWLCPGVYDSDHTPLSTPYGAGFTLAGSARDASRTILDGEGIDRILLASETLTVADITFQDGRSTEDEGGAIWANGDLTVRDCIFTGNSAYTDGGAISWSYGEVLTIEGSTFDDNYAYDAGGAIYVTGAGGWENWGLTIEGSAFTSNYSSNYAGAIGIGSGDVWSLAIRDTSFEDNEAGVYGGAISRVSGGSDDTATVTIEDATFLRTIQQQGGVVSLWADELALSITDTTFSDTVAERGPALLQSYGAGTVDLVRTSFTRSQAEDGGFIASIRGDPHLLTAEDVDFGAGPDQNVGLDLTCECGLYADLGASESFTCTGDGVWTE